MADIVEYTHGDYLISTDPARLDLDTIHHFLRDGTYWAHSRPRDVIERSLANSLCFGLYLGEAQVGLARVVTDYATFAWLCDVFVAEEQRGKGLGKWLIECVVKHPVLVDLGLFILSTRDANELYRRYGGFEPLPTPERWMVRRVQPPAAPVVTPPPGTKPRRRGTRKAQNTQAAPHPS